MTYQLSTRERWYLAAGALTVLVVAVWLGVVDPYREAMALLETKIDSRSGQLREVQALREEYRQLQRQMAEAESRLSRQEAGFSVFSYVENLTAAAGVKENLLSLRPQAASVQGEWREEAIEVKLEKIRLDQLVRFLHALETAEIYLPVKHLRAKPRFDKRSLLDATLIISHFERSA